MAPSAGANAVSIAVAAVVMSVALAATGAAAAAGLVALLATSAAVVGGGTARSADDSPTATPNPSNPAPSWARSFAHETFDSSMAAAVVLQGGTRSLKRPQLLQMEPCESHSKARKVRFNLSKNTVHEITPYAEVYGMHPRLLGIQPGWDCLRPLDTGDCDSEEEDDVLCQSFASLLRCPKTRFAPRAAWPVLIVTCFLLRAFGLSVMRELLLGAVIRATGHIEAAWTKAVEL